ncbi:hypothetical protein F6X40_10185 [Paraburkholderia sp. UCT31]|uniref:hypothetical protein n=1 Tax=Paraburkholderia sp. UCT31 TaxID=2615209 RepID=UPI0016553361|nr:hypothetical protein [Paraburkholderia sp. UCT31]MBC8737176.1 hypothetical protein [Paraburkholderia sp. UCT31]
MNDRTLADLQVNSYLLDETDVFRPILLERVSARGGSFSWKVSRANDVLNRDGEWEWEPSPSGRTAEFLARCRFGSAEDALAFYESWRARVNSD